MRTIAAFPLVSSFTACDLARRCGGPTESSRRPLRNGALGGVGLVSRLLSGSEGGVFDNTSAAPGAFCVASRPGAVDVGAVVTDSPLLDVVLAMSAFDSAAREGTELPFTSLWFGVSGFSQDSSSASSAGVTAAAWDGSLVLAAGFSGAVESFATVVGGPVRVFEKGPSSWIAPRRA
jgi:hypothetical protein